MTDEALDLLRQDLALHRDESRTHLAEMREESRTYLAEMREESKTYLAEMREEIKTSLAEMREEIKTSLAAMREENRIYFERLDASAREAREYARTTLRGLDQVVARLDEMRLEIRTQREEWVAAWRRERQESLEESAALRQGFLSVIDELRRHGLGGAPA